MGKDAKYPNSRVLSNDYVIDDAKFIDGDLPCFGQMHGFTPDKPLRLQQLPITGDWLLEGTLLQPCLNKVPTRVTMHEMFMQMAEAAARRSPCLSRQVGCVLVDGNKHVIATGYNGPPKNVEHCGTCRRKESGRDLYQCSAVHAEMNALIQCHGVDKIYAAYVTISPCLICARLLANTSCQIVFYREPYNAESMAEFSKFWDIRLKRRLERVPR